MDFDFGFTLGVSMAFWIGVLVWPTNTKKDKQALSILCAIQIVVVIVHELLNG